MKKKEKVIKARTGLSDRGSGKCVTRLHNESVGERLGFKQAQDTYRHFVNR